MHCRGAHTQRTFKHTWREALGEQPVSLVDEPKAKGLKSWAQKTTSSSPGVGVGGGGAHLIPLWPSPAPALLAWPLGPEASWEELHKGLAVGGQASSSGAPAN